MSDPLHSAWLKLDRAKTHVDALRDEIFEATNGEPDVARMKRFFNRDKEAVVAYVHRLPEIRDSYGVIVGDAIHNFRSALDHTWWALAASHLGRKPTKDEASKIQFPILSNITEQEWKRHRFLTYVSGDAADKAKPMQPFMNEPRGTGWSSIDRLELLAELSNVDKHRFVHVAVTVAEKLVMGTPEVFSDCEPRLTEASTLKIDVHNFPNGPIVKVGDPIFVVPVTPTGPKPDVELKAEFTCAISLQLDDGIVPNMLDSLERIGVRVTSCISEFEPLL